MKRRCLGFFLASIGAMACFADYVINVESGQVETFSPISTGERVVKTGWGTAILSNGNTFGSEVVVSNGFLEADYVASGLSQTHLVLCGAANNRPGIFKPKGSSFTAPVAAAGAGTVELKGFCGLQPADADLTINLGNGQRLVQGADGFNVSELNIGRSSSYKTYFLNDICHNGKDITVKNPDSMPAYFFGAVSNNTANGKFYYFDGTMNFIGQKGRVDVYTKNYWYLYNGNVVFSNSTVRSWKDFIVGGSANMYPNVTFKDCDYESRDGWDQVNGAPGTCLTLDGGRHFTLMRFGVGYNDAGKTGMLVLTNGAEMSVGTFAQNSGRVEQYSGTLAITNDGSYVSRIGGSLNSDSKTLGADDAVYCLHGGSLYLGSGHGFYTGATQYGKLVQTGGVFGLGSYHYIGALLGSTGEYLLHGGIYTNRSTGLSAVVGYRGTGTVSVANGGRFVSTCADGVLLGQHDTSSGRFIVSPDGEASVNYFYSENGQSAFVFNGGTVRPNGTAHKANYFKTTLSRVVMTPYGGCFDTDGVGDFVIPRPLLDATDAEDLRESIAHRWKFDGHSLTDCIGGKTAVVKGAIDWTDDAIRLTGGTNGSSQVNLGTDLLPTDGRGVTIETWVRRRNCQNWARVFECGHSTSSATTNFFVAFNVGAGAGKWYFKAGGIVEQEGDYRPQDGVLYHVSVVFSPLADGTWDVVAAMRDAETGDLLDRIAARSKPGWKLSDVAQSDGLWLGSSSFVSDNDPAADYLDFRIHHRVMTEAQLCQSAQQGADAKMWFRKRGLGKLTLTGANDYRCGTAVDAGTLVLASGSTLPNTDVCVSSGAVLDLGANTQVLQSLSGSGTVRFSGSLTVEGDILPGGADGIGQLRVEGEDMAATGRLVIDMDAGGNDRLVSTGAIDLSDLQLQIRGMSNLSRNRAYDIVSGSHVTGRFKSVQLPRGWSVTYSDAGVRIRPIGLVLIVR